MPPSTSSTASTPLASGAPALPAELELERLGGLAGIGLPGSALRCRARLATADLAEPDRLALVSLMQRAEAASRSADPAGPAPAGLARDGFRHQLRWRDAQGRPREAEVPEADLPAVLRDALQDEWADPG